MDVGEPTSSGPTELVAEQTGALSATHRKLPSTREKEMERGDTHTDPTHKLPMYIIRKGEERSRHQQRSARTYVYKHTRSSYKLG
jgi:hypothetical protein